MSRIESMVDVQVPADTVYQIWHNFENFPSLMRGIEEVRDLGFGRSHWKAKGPLGAAAEWDAEITEDEPARVIAWRSLDGSQVTTSGRVEFEGAGSSTRLRVVMEYEAPGGLIGDVVTKVFSNPAPELEEDLRRFKDGVERGQQFAPRGGQAGVRASDQATPRSSTNAGSSGSAGTDTPSGGASM